MQYPVDKEMFVRRWCEAKGDHDQNEIDFAEALVNVINKAFYAGVEAGKRGVSNAPV